MKKFLISIFCALAIVVGIFFISVVREIFLLGFDNNVFYGLDIYDPSNKTVVDYLYIPSIFCGAKHRCKELDVRLEQLYNTSNIYGKEFQESVRKCADGINCSFFSNQNGELKTKVCNEDNICLARKYSSERDLIDICYKYDEKGICNCGREFQLDKNGRVISERYCPAWDQYGFCKEIGAGDIQTYNEDGKIATYKRCNKWDDNYNCVDNSSYCTTWRIENQCITYGGHIYNYDDQGRYLGYRSCERWRTPSVCEKYADYGIVYEYNKKGDLKRIFRCDKWNDDGTCKTFGARMWLGVKNINKKERRICK